MKTVVKLVVKRPAKDMAERTNHFLDITKVLLPVIIGALLTLGATTLTANKDRASKTLDTLRNSYAATFASLDAMFAELSDCLGTVCEDEKDSQGEAQAEILGRKIKAISEAALKLDNYERGIRKSFYLLILQEPRALERNKWAALLKKFSSNIWQAKLNLIGARIEAQRFKQSDTPSKSILSDFAKAWSPIDDALFETWKQIDKVAADYESLRDEVITSRRWVE
jgi:hypothetical protein